jgi:hypothetical protein
MYAKYIARKSRERDYGKKKRRVTMPEHIYMLKIDKDLWKQFKAAAALNDKDMKDVLTELIKNYLGKVEK